MSDYIYIKIPFAEHEITWVGMEDPSSAYPKGYPVFIHINWLESKEVSPKSSVPDFMKKGKYICVPYYQSEDRSSAVRISPKSLPENVYYCLLREHYPTMKWMQGHSTGTMTACEILQEQMKFQNIQ